MDVNTDRGPNLDFILSYRLNRWHAQGNGLTLVGDDLLELESMIERELQSHPDIHLEDPSHVNMRFDISTLPRWLRQYQSHYFNYVLIVRPGGATRDDD